jgi:hypothetical protein
MLLTLLSIAGIAGGLVTAYSIIYKVFEKHDMDPGNARGSQNDLLVLLGSLGATGAILGGSALAYPAYGATAAKIVLIAAPLEIICLFVLIRLSWIVSRRLIKLVVKLF